MSNEIVTENDNINGLEENITEKQVRFNHVIVPSLKHIATTCIVTTICKTKHTLNEISQSGFRKSVQLLRRKLSLLPLPKSIVKKSFPTCKIVAFEVYRIMKFNYEVCNCGFYLKVPKKYLECITFNMDGRIDLIKTLSLMQEKGYPNHKIFIAGSHLCSEKLVTTSWEKFLSDFHHHGSVSEIYNHLESKYEFDDCVLTKYWSYLMQDRLQDLSYSIFPRSEILTHFERIDPSRTNYYMLLISVKLTYSYAVAYFYPMLTDEEKSSTIEHLTMIVLFTVKSYGPSELLSGEFIPIFEIAFFLISKITERGLQISMFKDHLHFLIYPLIGNLFFQKYLEPVIKLVWDSLDENSFNEVITSVLKLLVRRSHKAKELLRELWPRSNESFKKSFGEYFCRIGGKIIQYEPEYDLFKYPEILKLVLSECSEEFIKDYLCWRVGERLRDFVPKDITYINVIDNLLKLMFSTDLEMFKKSVIDDYLHDLSILIDNDDYDSINASLNWGLTTQDEINAHKQDSKFVLGYIEFMICESKLTSSFEKIDEFLNWCFNSEVQKIEEFKRNNALKLYNSLGIEKWETFVKLVNWCFVADIEVFFFRDSISRFEMLEKQFQRQDSLDINLNRIDYLNNLLNWCLTPKMIKKFKKSTFKLKYLLGIVNGTISIYIYLYDGYEFPSRITSEKLAIWYGSSLEPKTIRKFVKLVKRTKRRLESKTGYETLKSHFLNREPETLTFLDDFVVALESLYLS